MVVSKGNPIKNPGRETRVTNTQTLFILILLMETFYVPTIQLQPNNLDNSR